MTTAGISAAGGTQGQPTTTSSSTRLSLPGKDDVEERLGAQRATRLVKMKMGATRAWDSTRSTKAAEVIKVVALIGLPIVSCTLLAPIYFPVAGLALLAGTIPVAIINHLEKKIKNANPEEKKLLEKQKEKAELAGMIAVGVAAAPFLPLLATTLRAAFSKTM